MELSMSSFDDRGGNDTGTNFISFVKVLTVFKKKASERMKKASVAAVVKSLFLLKACKLVASGECGPGGKNIRSLAANSE
jgi:hypothetical protein